LAASDSAAYQTHQAEARDILMIRRKIFLVDDDAELRRTLAEQLMHYREFELIEAGTANEALRQVRDGHVDLMILDVGLPDMDGREAVKILRRDGFKSPILMLTGHDTDSDEILGLESGANDYVTKPFRFSVLLARIRAALRQHDQSEDVVFTIGPYSFQPAAKLLESADGGKIRLTDKETSILKYLYRQGPRTISREVLLKEVWGYNNRVTTHTLETHIYRLRQKIERDPSNARLLVTEEGGYRLVP
jgi:DNA-binding response OmpR family regulator